MSRRSHVPATVCRSHARCLPVLVFLGLTVFGFTGQPSVAADGLDREVLFDIPEQELSVALVQFGAAAGVSINADLNVTKPLRNHVVQGRLRIDTGLNTL